ncbi:uncharacterized protein EDB93DRAFT_1259124 [Suillus bovinus]|uniref:uncharacterized protein n=1 Tax=Suillus bovinus TaxID=48563 RepID=UPI001B85C72A|nr:uncharacterized protein EDB93DRAFT_1259124 [Suillus bovinus]KAG2123304.1 hypothetical protein EDB93DRAFT_1259124 [Suillus bovinus]
MDDQSSLWLTLDLLPLKSLVLYMGIHFINCITMSHVLKNLTHLDLIDSEVLRKPDTGLEALHSLTHICLVLQMDSSHPAAIVRLVGNARLCVLAFRVKDSHSRIESFLEGCGIQDERIVLLSTVMRKRLGYRNLRRVSGLSQASPVDYPKRFEQKGIAACHTKASSDSRVMTIARAALKAISKTILKVILEVILEVILSVILTLSHARLIAWRGQRVTKEIPAIQWTMAGVEA